MTLRKGEYTVDLRTKHYRTVYELALEEAVYVLYERLRDKMNKSCIVLK